MYYILKTLYLSSIAANMIILAFTILINTYKWIARASFVDTDVRRYSTFYAFNEMLIIL